MLCLCVNVRMYDSEWFCWCWMLVLRWFWRWRWMFLGLDFVGPRTREPTNMSDLGGVEDSMSGN